MNLTNCSSGSNVLMPSVAGVLLVSLTIHAIAPVHNLGDFLLPPQEHIELSSKSTASVGIYAAPFAVTSSGSTVSSTSFMIRS